MESYCNLCKIELKSGDPAYGLTDGVVDAECFGFRMDCNKDWDLYCCDCMNKIDKLLADARRDGTAL